MEISRVLLATILANIDSRQPERIEKAKELIQNELDADGSTESDTAEDNSVYEPSLSGENGGYNDSVPSVSENSTDAPIG